MAKPLYRLVALHLNGKMQFFQVEVEEGETQEQAKAKLLAQLAAKN